LFILFGINLRAGFILLHAVFWNGMVTFHLKEWFALPRPCNVDQNVQFLRKGVPNPTVFEKQGAQSFFGSLPADVVDSLQANPIDSWGLPSGHTSNAVTLWGSIALFYKKTWARILAGFMLIFIPLSRIYLGRHFLADVLAGYVLGLAFVLLFYYGVYRQEWFQNFFESSWNQTIWNLTTWLLLLYLVLVPGLLFLFPSFNRPAVGALLGLNLGYLLLKIGGIPRDSGTLVQRAARMLVAGVFYLGADRLGDGFQSLLSLQTTGAWEFLKAVLTMMLVIWGSTEISIWLGFFKREE
jgi:membrane-associated phospholipid phosphatase